MKNDEAIQLGRRLREGALSKEERAAMKTAFTSGDDLAAAAIEKLEGISSVNDAAITARDDAESLLVVLGVAELADAEKRVAVKAAEVDARMLATRDEWGSSAIATKDPWLRRVAALDASPWWLDLVSLAALRGAAKAFDPASAFRDGPRPAAMKLRSRSTKASLHLYAEVVGMEDDPSRVALERGSVVARLFDGEVEVIALGFRVDQEDVPPGLCIVKRGGGIDSITNVTLAGVVAGQGRSGWWAPLPPDHAGLAALVVHLGEHEESLELELTP